VVDDLGSRPFIENTSRILELGTGADRQLRIYEQTNNLVTVADFIVQQFLVNA
jgi:carboxylate-amine ligase